MRFNATVRGDNDDIVIGAGSNVQDGAVLHVDPGYPMRIGDRVSIGHQVMLHGCTIGDRSLIGIQAIVLNGAVIGSDSLVGAGALVTEGKQFPARSLILGSPAKVVRELTDKDLLMLKGAADSYIQRSALQRHAAPHRQYRSRPALAAHRSVDDRLVHQLANQIAVVQLQRAQLLHHEHGDQLPWGRSRNRCRRSRPSCSRPPSQARRPDRRPATAKPRPKV
jgi:carbonic anhydrase/acetyltransferase-like protein (isoleucine patch superfamily)